MTAVDAAAYIVVLPAGQGLRSSSVLDLTCTKNEAGATDPGERIPSRW